MDTAIAASISPYRVQFTRKHVFLAVVHAETPAQSLENARIAEGEGVDGIFIINHHISPLTLVRCYDHVRTTLPKFWIGLNFLNVSPIEALSCLPKDANGLWYDNGGIYEGGQRPAACAENFAADRRARQVKALYFGGVAFKYQEKVVDLELVTRLAVPHMDVITTSGERTGVPPTVEKMMRMRKAAPDTPLAVASGMTAENVARYWEFVDCFLVASSISDSHTQLNRKLVREFRNKTL